MRNLSLEKKLVKNARVVVREIRVGVQTLNQDGSFSSQHVLPRINFELVPPWATYTVCRRQFPLRLVYATTFNSCQGLTLDRVVLDLSIQPFAHGQLHTALSRVRQRNDLRLLLPEDHSIFDPQTVNVVYPDLLLDDET
jgi:hypothetical protein